MWTSSDNGACSDGLSANGLLTQSSVMDIGLWYFVKITLDSSIQGSISIYGFENNYELSENGTTSFFAQAKYTEIDIVSNNFIGCISQIEINHIAFYVIKDSEGNIVFQQTDLTGVTGDKDFIQYQIDWTNISEGCYYIEFSSDSLTYQTPCISLALLHDCSLQLQWKNDQDAMGFDYSGLDFEQSMRIDGKLWKFHYKTEDQEIFEFSNGAKKKLYARSYKQMYLTIKEMPEYMFDAFRIALNSDRFLVDNVEYIFEDQQITPTHRNSSNLPSIEVELTKQENLLNSNCG